MKNFFYHDIYLLFGSYQGRKVAKYVKNPRGALESAFAAQLAWAMEDVRMSPKDLAKIASVTPGAVRNYLGGVFFPRPSVQLALEQALGVRFVMNDANVTVPQKVSASADGAPIQQPVTKMQPQLFVSEIKKIKTMIASALGADPDTIGISIHFG